MNTKSNPASEPEGSDGFGNALRLVGREPESPPCAKYKRHLPPDPELLELLQANVVTICDLVKDVFITSFDLVLLDYEHGILGGGSKVLEKSAVTDSVSAAEDEIRNCLYRIRPALPFGLCSRFNVYFLPALTMSVQQRTKMAGLCDRGLLATAITTKRAFVNRVPIGPFDSTKGSLPGWSEWWDFILDATGAPEVDDIDIVQFNSSTTRAFWFERIADRMSGIPDLIGSLGSLSFEELAADRFNRELEMYQDLEFLDRLDEGVDLYDPSRFGSHPDKRA